MPKPITHILAEIRFGECVAELTDEMAKLVAAVGNTGKAGTLTLTLKLKPSGGGSVELTDDIKSKIPALPKGTSIFFATPGNDLVRNDPRQPDLAGLRSVDPAPIATTDLREVAA